MAVRIRPAVTLAILVAMILWDHRSAWAQEGDLCFVLCAPTLSFEPTLTFTDLFAKTEVLDLQTNDISEVESERQFEMILSMGIPTAIPRVGLTVEAIWAPFVKGDANPFTAYTSEELVEEVNENPLELEVELNLHLLENEQTAGWVETHFDIVDKFSPAEEPGASHYYTHKLDFELDTAVSVFNWLSDGSWLKNLELEGSLDYLATGLPAAGDEVPRGKLRFLDDASRWSFSVLLVVPIAPLRP
jgi:hypothetical protein